MLPPAAGFAQEAAATHCHAVIIGGLPGTPVHARRFADWTRRFQAYLVGKAGVPAAQVTTLTAPVVTADQALQAMVAVAEHTAPADPFVLVLVGHGDTADGEAVLSLPGRDLHVAELKIALARIPSDNQVLLLLNGDSGEMLAPLAATNRVIVAATSPGEQSDPVFAEFFLNILEAEPMGGVSLLQAFNRASRDTAQWIRRISQTEAGAWHVEGKEAIRLFQKLSAGPATMPGARQLDPSSKPLDPDPEVSLKTTASQEEAQRAGIVPGTRIITEHALLADRGSETGIAAVRPEGYVAVTGAKPGDAGFHAASVVLGR